jgi:Glyoxalase-like domain
VKAEVDHLVVAARSLAEGVQWCEATLGITPGPGGRHALMGTHNRLFSVASEVFANAYFEIIAIDPDAPDPGRARWFGLDALDLSNRPRLVTFVARVPALDTELASMRDAGFDPGRPIAASRDTPQGLLRWRIALRDDGRVLCGGALPTLIEWGQRHPAASMPASGVTLRSLTLRGVSPTLAPPDTTVARDTGPALEACLDTPRGAVTLTTEDA